MKIRTDFVTNSSSSNITEVVVDNPVLLDILQRYMEMGMFGETILNFWVGCFPTDIYSFNSDKSNYLDFQNQFKAPAFYMFEDPCNDGWNSIWDCPKSLDEVITYIIEVMDYHAKQDINQELLNQMKEELHHKETDINEGYLKVHWRYEIDIDERESGDPKNMLFTFDLENGENFVVQYFDDADFEDQDYESDNNANP